MKEFYKLYSDSYEGSHYKRFYKIGSSADLLNNDIKNNPRWRHEIIKQSTTYRGGVCDEVISTIFVRWVTLDDELKYPFNGEENNENE